MNRKRILILAVAGVLVGATAVVALVFPGSLGLGGNEYYLYCPKCGYEKSYNPNNYKGKVLCPNCFPQPDFLVPTTYSRAKIHGDSARETRMWIVIGLGAAVVVGVSGYLFVIFRRSRGIEPWEGEPSG